MVLIGIGVVLELVNENFILMDNLRELEVLFYGLLSGFQIIDKYDNLLKKRLMHPIDRVEFEIFRGELLGLVENYLVLRKNALFIVY